MQDKKINIRQVVTYQSHNRRANGAVTLNLNAEYSELTHTIELQQFLNLDVEISAKPAGEKQFALGMFRLKKSTIMDDGESKLQFEGLSDFVEVDNLNNLPLKSDDVPQFVVFYSALLDSDSDDAEEDKEENVDEEEWDEWED